MKPRQPPRLSNQILDEATTWFIEMNERAPDKRAREAFDRWLRTSPEHVRAYLQISAHWEELSPGRHVSLESIDTLVSMGRSDSSVVPLSLDPAGPRGESPSQSARPSGPPIAGRSSFRFKRLALAASLLLAVGIGFTAWQLFFAGVYSTQIGEQRSLRLADGSTVELNARSRIKVSYSERVRQVELLEGQALFQVAKDTQRPFIVRSGNTSVRAVGTRFDVRQKQNGTVVTVVEGRVAVFPVTPINATRHETSSSGSADVVPAAQPTSVPHSTQREILLGAGEQLMLTAEAIVKDESANLAAATAWTQGRLVFSGTPLSEVVEEFNRYNPVPLVVLDPTLANERISGSFSSSDPSALLRFLREVGMFNVDETGSAIQISRK